MDMDLSETETLRPVLRSATQEPESRPYTHTSPRITAATAKGNLRVALVGAGYVAQFHRDILAETPGVNLVAVCDADAERARAGARELRARAARLGPPLGVNHNNVWPPAFIRLLDHVRADRIGRVEHVRVCLSVPLAQLEAGDFSHWMFRSD